MYKPIEEYNKMTGETELIMYMSDENRYSTKYLKQFADFYGYIYKSSAVWKQHQGHYMHRMRVIDPKDPSLMFTIL